MWVIGYMIYVFAAASLLAIRYRNSKREWLLRFVLVAVFPVIGWLFPLFWPDAFRREPKERFDDYVNRQHEVHKQRRSFGLYARVGPSKELDVIPIEDALLVSEHQDRRRVMIDVLKQDATRYVEILQRAVSNEDTETSHYAVSAIMEVKRKLLIALQDLSVKYENHKDDVYLARTYAEVLKGYIRSGFMDERTLIKYRYEYLDVLRNLTAQTGGPDSEWAYQEKVGVELELGLLSDAESTGIQYIEKHPMSEEAYLSLIRVYYVTKSPSKLCETIGKLKQTPVRLSNRALTIVRFWSEGA